MAPRLLEDSETTKARCLDLAYARKRLAKLREGVAACQQAAQGSHRAELTSALTAIIDDATQLRMLYRPRNWRTLDEHVRAHRAAKEVPAGEDVADYLDGQRRGRG